MNIAHRILKQGTISGGIIVAIVLVIISFPVYFSETLNSFTYIDALVVILISHFWCCGAYLWLKGFSSFSSQLSNPISKALYILFNIFAGNFIYYHNRTNLNGNS